MSKKGTQIPEKGPHGDPGPQKRTHCVTAPTGPGRGSFVPFSEGEGVPKVYFPQFLPNFTNFTNPLAFEKFNR